jgi:hypothetical protein
MPRMLPWFLPLLAGALPAQDIQNMDISTLFGYSPTAASTVAGRPSRLESDGGFAMGILYGYQFKQTAAGSLWYDMSQVFSFGDLVDPASGRSHFNGKWFFAPGLRLQFPVPNDRIAVYGVAGFGYANRNDYTVSPANANTLQNRTQHSWTVPVGAGLIFRFSQHLGLKVECRNFLTPAGRGTARSHHNLFLLFGMSRHF